jgi:hypothetical protein
MGIREQFSYARPPELIEKEKKILSMLSKVQIRRLNEIDQYMALRCQGSLYFAELICNEPVSESIRNVVSQKEADLILASYERGRQIWLTSLSKIEKHLAEQPEMLIWWQEQKVNFANTIYADVVCQNLNSKHFSEYLGEPIHDKKFPVIFEDNYQLELGGDGHWVVKNHNFKDLRLSFWNLITLIYDQQQRLGLNEFDLSESQVIELSRIRQEATDEADAIGENLSREERQREWQKIARDHITRAWNEILLPRQRDLITKLIRDRYRTMAGPLEVLFREELDENTKQTVRNEFVKCRDQLLEVEAQLMADLLAVVRKELNPPNLITGEVRPKYLQPSLCLLELRLISNGRLHRAKDESGRTEAKLK